MSDTSINTGKSVVPTDGRPVVAAQARGVSRWTAALVALNFGLVVALVMSVWPWLGGSLAQGLKVTPEASAQAGSQLGGAQPRARGQYMLLAGRVGGTSTSGVYIIDSANREVAAVRWDRNQKRLVPLGFRDLATDSGQAQREK